MTGTHTEIVEIIAPDSASPGDLVTVEVRVKKLYWDWLPITVWGWIGYGITWVCFDPEYKWFRPEDTEPFPFTHSFIMPNDDVWVYVWSYYGPNGDWIIDDFGQVKIALAEVVEPYKGTMSKMELEYDESRGIIPVSDVPQGKRGLVHIWGKNDMSTSQKLGIYWIVRDPDGITVEEYSDWEFGSTSPDDDHHFIGGRFDLAKIGTYSIHAGLLMNPDNPTYVHLYYGDLCTISPIEYSGEIIKKELEFSGSGDGTVPVANVPLGKSAKLHVWGKNSMVTSQGMGIYWFVADPDGEIAEEYEDWGGIIGAGQDHEFISSGSFTLNKVGKYTTWIDLLMGSEDNPVVIMSARYIGELCTVVVELVPTFSELSIASFEKR